VQSIHCKITPLSKLSPKWKLAFWSQHLIFAYPNSPELAGINSNRSTTYYWHLTIRMPLFPHFPLTECPSCIATTKASPPRCRMGPESGNGNMSQDLAEKASSVVNWNNIVVKCVVPTLMGEEERAKKSIARKARFWAVKNTSHSFLWNLYRLVMMRSLE